MDLLQLHYFQTVARLEHVTRAAEELRVAQPALSKTIARLEAELGVPLFDRRGRRVALNAGGRAFLRHVHRVFREVEDGRQELADLAGLARGTVTVAATGSALHVMLFFANLIRALLIFNGLRSRYCQRALLVYHYHQDSVH
jgi:DNA-binding transcriptional LysR family regulator